MPIYMNRSHNGITFKFLPFIYITGVLGAQKNRLSRQAQWDGVFQLFWGAQKNRLIEKVIFRAHNMCLG